MIDRPAQKSLKAGWPLCLITAALATAAWTMGPPASNPEADFDRLLSERRYLELRRVLGSTGNSNRPEILYVRGRVANAFNQIAASIDDLTAYLREAGAGQAKTRLVETLNTLADDFVKSFQYGKAADIRKELLPLLKGELRPDALADFQATSLLWEALAAAPPQSVTVSEDTELSPAGSAGVPVTIGGRTVSLLPDSGASLSLISRSEAERLGLQDLGVAVDLSTSTGQRVTARASVVPEMRIGRIIVRNAVFLIVPEEMLYFPDIKEQRTGLLGFPVLAGLKELTFFGTGRIRVPARPRLDKAPNFFLEKENPVLETNFEGRRLLFHLDTGAIKSQLYPPFFRAFRDRIVARGAPVGENIEGVGTDVTVPAYLAQGLRFRLAGRNVVFDRPIAVLTKATDPSSEIFDGVLGLDILAHFQALTISYEAMRVELE
jgi:Aspartyl protease